MRWISERRRLLLNDDWEEGLASSIRAGVKAVQAEAPTAEGLLLMTCDQPRVTAEHLRAADPDVLCAIGADGDRIDLRWNARNPGNLSAPGHA